MEHPGPDQRVKAFNRESPVLDAGGDQDGAARDPGAAGQVTTRSGLRLQVGCGVEVDQLSAQEDGLFSGPAGQLAPADAIAESRGSYGSWTSYRPDPPAPQVPGSASANLRMPAYTEAASPAGPAPMMAMS
jgi:hypothetical protein